jgi:hypothetical protein
MTINEPIDEWSAQIVNGHQFLIPYSGEKLILV